VPCNVPWCTQLPLQVVYEELRELMGGAQAELTLPKYGPAVILMAGLQGTGKTTAAGKLALFLKKKGLRVLLVATDVYRPGACCSAGWVWVLLAGAPLVLGAAAAVRAADAAAARLLLCGGQLPASSHPSPHLPPAAACSGH
jgi:signal recognition particle GTPase